MSIILAIFQLIKDILGSSLMFDILIIAVSVAVAMLVRKILTYKHTHKQTGGL